MKGYDAAHGHYHVLTDEQVVELRQRSAAGETNDVLAEEFHVSVTHVSALATGRRRRGAGGPLRGPRGVGSAGRKVA